MVYAKIVMYRIIAQLKDRYQKEKQIVNSVVQNYRRKHNQDYAELV